MEVQEETTDHDTSRMNGVREAGAGEPKAEEGSAAAREEEPAGKGETIKDSADSSAPQQNGMHAESAAWEAGKALEESEADDKEQGSAYCFSKGAYFIGKAVWGKV